MPVKKGVKKPPLFKIFSSPIHNDGLKATKDIRKGTRIIEYLGEKITKEESNRRAWARIKEAKKDGKGAVYIFELNRKYDIDGNYSYNLARLINHSCEPNCEAEIAEDRIWIKALRKINQGEEFSFDYGYSLDNFEDHPCLCGSTNCVGYIVSAELWPKLKRQLARNNKKVSSKTKKKVRKVKRTKKSLPPSKS